jgi:hypothetical protein
VTPIPNQASVDLFCSWLPAHIKALTCIDHIVLTHHVSKTTTNRRGL